MKVNLEIDLEDLAILNTALSKLSFDAEFKGSYVNINSYKPIRSVENISGNELMQRIGKLKGEIQNQINS